MIDIDIGIDIGIDVDIDVDILIYWYLKIPQPRRVGIARRN